MIPPKQDELFQKFWPVLICLIIFEIGNVVGTLRVPVHFLFFKILRFFGHSSWEYHSTRLKEIMKAKDCVADSSLLDGEHDETISNHAGTIWKEKEFASPLWVLIVKKLTDYWEDGHIVTSIETTRSKAKK